MLIHVDMQTFLWHSIARSIDLLLVNKCIVSTLCCECQGHNANVTVKRSISRSRTKVAHKRAVLHTNCIVYFRTCYLIPNICLDITVFFLMLTFNLLLKLRSCVLFHCFPTCLFELSVHFHRSIPAILKILVIHIIMTCKTLMYK